MNDDLVFKKCKHTGNTVLLIYIIIIIGHDVEEKILFTIARRLSFGMDDEYLMLIELRSPHILQESCRNNIHGPPVNLW